MQQQNYNINLYQHVCWLVCSYQKYRHKALRWVGLVLKTTDNL